MTTSPDAVDVAHVLDPIAVPPADVLLAGLDRGGVIESWHRGIASVIAPDGQVLLSLGDDTAQLLPRSTLKLVIAQVVLDLGLDLRGAEIALAAASIDATPAQVEFAEGLRTRLRLTDDDLTCPAVRVPGTRDRSRLAHQCVGKHLALAAAARDLLPADLPYADPRHPLQQRITATLGELAGESVGATVIDGCGAPVTAVSTRGLARALQRVARGVVGDAMRAHAWLVQAPGTPDTVLCESGFVAKRGADGVQFVMAPNGTSVVVNTSDGAERVGPTVALALLRRVGAIDAADEHGLLARVAPAVSGEGRRVGALRVSADVLG